MPFINITRSLIILEFYMLLCKITVVLFAYGVVQ